MTNGDVAEMLETLHALYPQRFVLPSSAMGTIWAGEFAAVEADQARKAVHRWAMQHPNGPAPNMLELKDICGWIDDEQRQHATRQRPIESRGVEEVLTEAASADGSIWAHGHVQLFFGLLGTPPSEKNAKAAEICRKHAETYHDDQGAWLAEAAWYDVGAPLSLPPRLQAVSQWAVPDMTAGGRLDGKQRAANDAEPPF